MTGKKKRNSASGWKVKVVSKESHVTRHVAEGAPNKSSEVNAFRNGESSGNLDVQPLLAIGNVDLIAVSEDLQGSMKETRTKAPNKILNEEEINAEKAVHAKRQRAGHLGELRKRRNVVQDLITNPGIEATEVEEGVARYEEAFRNFVSSHDNYLRYEDDEE